MPVQFILGRSGSGKTHHCLEAVKDELLTQPDGPALILLVPEQATFQVEQALLADGRLQGYHRVRVWSFDRLARQVLWEKGTPSLPILNEFGKQMILRRLLQQLHDRFKIFQRVTDRPGFLKQLSALIRELIQFRQSPADLLHQREALVDANDGSVKPLIDKLDDLALIFRSYRDYLTDRYIDPDDFPDLLARHCRDIDWLRGSRIWLDGFAGFTLQQYHALLALIEQADQSYISLCLDPAHPQYRLAYENPDDPSLLDPTDLFHPTLLTFQKLLSLLNDRHIDTTEPIILPDENSPVGGMPRFQTSPALADLERNFPPPTTSPPTSDRTSDSSNNDIPQKDIVVIETPHRRAEIEAAARHILNLVRDGGYRYRDIAVILRDFTDYQNLIEAAFADYDIPCFIDRRRSVHHHPLIGFVRSALQIILTDFKTEHVLDFLKTDLAPLDRTAADRLENYALAHGIHSSRWHDDYPWTETIKPTDDTDDQTADDEQTIETAHSLEYDRRRTLAPLLEFRETLYPDGCQSDTAFPVTDLTAALLNLLEQCDIPARLSHWHDTADTLEDAQIHAQVYSDFIDRLDDLVESLDTVELTLNEFFEILNAALEQMSLRLVPPTLDQVLVGTIERSRHPQIRAAFVLGCHEYGFPRVSEPDAFFTDHQRERLDELGLELGPTTARKLLHEQYLAYIAVTRPHEFLWISYPLADESGSALNPSVLIETVLTAAPNAPLIRLAESDARPDTHTIDTLSQLTRQLALALAHRRDTAQPLTSPWPELKQYALNHPAWKPLVARTLASVTWQNRAVLDPEILTRLYPAPELTGSVSRLETYAACPCQYYARHTLKLEPRDELKLAAPDMGSFYHDALYHIFRTLTKAKLDWRNADDDKLTAIVARVVRFLIEKHHRYAALRDLSDRNRYLLDETRDRLLRLCRSIRSTTAAGTFRQRHAEWRFGYDSEKHLGEFDLPDGRKLILRGKIDRIDTAENEDAHLGFLVIDYKSSAQSFSFDRFYHGLSLQLIAYLLVANEHFNADCDTPAVPAAALFLPIHIAGKSQTGPPPDAIFPTAAKDTESTDPQTIHRASGLYDRDWLESLDTQMQPGNRSAYYNFGINKNGDVRSADTAPVLTTEEMNALLDHGRRRLTEWASDILAGRIPVAPYRLGQNETPCPHCDFRTLCRFDFNLDRYRPLPLIGKENVLTKLKS